MLEADGLSMSNVIFLQRETEHSSDYENKFHFHEIYVQVLYVN